MRSRNIRQQESTVKWQRNMPTNIWPWCSLGFRFHCLKPVLFSLSQKTQGKDDPVVRGMLAMPTIGLQKIGRDCQFVNQYFLGRIVDGQRSTP